MPDVDTDKLFHRSAAGFRSESLREEDRSFEAVLTTETPAAIYDWDTRQIVDEVLLASGVRFMDYLPLLRSHSRSSELDVIGHHDAPRLDGEVWVARAYVSEPAHDADPVREIWQRIKGGHLRAVSIGYWPAEYIDIPAGKTATVAGRSFTAGSRTLRITTQTTVFESSIVAVGADSQALIRGLRPPKPVATVSGARFRKGFR